MKENNRSIDGLRPRSVIKTTRTARILKPRSENKNPESKKNLERKPLISDEYFLEKNTRSVDWSELAEDKNRKVVATEFSEPANSFKFKSRKIKPEAKTKKSKKKALKFFTGGFLILILGLLAIAYVWGDSIVAKLTGGKSGLIDVITTVIENKKIELKKDQKGRTNVLIFGTSGYNMGGSGHDGAQLTDSIMVASFDQESKDLAMLSLPRDLKMPRTCTATGKINEVYWCANIRGNNEEAGANALSDTLEKILGLEIHYRAHINWGALVQVVDGLGGITVTLEENINDPMTRTQIQAGVPTKLNGEQALGLARARYGTSGGDFTRGRSQQKILLAIREKALAKGLGPGEILGMINALGDNLRTNLTIQEIKGFTEIAKDLQIETVRQIPLMDWEKQINLLKYANINGISYVIPSAGVGNYKEIQKYIKKEISNDVVSREEARIVVLNGTGEPGVAGRERKKLEENNFRIERIGDAPENDYPRYTLYDLTKKMPGTLKKLEERYQVTAKNINELPDKILKAGADFILIIGKEN